MTGIGDDITDRIRAENSLKDANKNLETRLTEIEGLQNTLREQAFRDSLTGLLTADTWMKPSTVSWPVPVGIFIRSVFSCSPP